MDLDPTPFFFDIKNAKKIFCFHIFSHNLLTGFRLKINFLLQFCVKILFCRHYFSPLNTFIRKEIRTSGLWIRIREAQKHADPSDPVPDPQHCGILPAGGIHFLESIPGLHKHLKIRATQKQHRRDMWGPSCRKFVLAVNFVLIRRYFLIVFNEYYFFFMVGPGSARQRVRAPGCLTIIWLGASPVSKLYQRNTGRLRKRDDFLSEGDWSQIVRWRERRVLYKSFNTLWLQLTRSKGWSWKKCAQGKGARWIFSFSTL